MVAPLVIITVIGIIIAGLMFTDAGQIVHSALQQTGLTDPKAYKIMENEQENTTDIVDGFEKFVHELIGVGNKLGNDSIEATDFNNNVIGMTKEEATDINAKGGDFFTSFADVFFKGHAFIVAVINGMSPVEMGIALVSIIALLVSLFLMFTHARHMGKHWAIIVMVVAFFVLFFMVVGSNASI